MSGILSYIGKQEIVQNSNYSNKTFNVNCYNQPKPSMVNDNYAPKSTFQNSIFSSNNNTTLNLDFYKNGTDTHRAPQEDAHTKRSMSGRFSIVVKGEIENDQEIIDCLNDYEYSFKSYSKAEIVAQLIEWFTVYSNFSVKEAIERTFSKLKGNLSAVIYDENTPNSLFAVRNGHPLFLGLAANKAYVASKKEKLSKYTDSFITIEDKTIATIKDEGKIVLQKLTF